MKKGWISLAVIISVLGLILAGCGKESPSKLPEKHEEKTVTKQIFSLQTAPSIAGEFVYGVGLISGEMRYYVYVEKDGGLILRDVDAEETVIKEFKDNEQPRLVQTYDIRIVPKQNGLDLFDTPTKETSTAYEFWTLKHSTLYVPINTVKKEFNASIPK